MYRIHLDQFEGPLDLLLFFIRRDELDIYDIPVAQIADEFLEYVRILEEVNLDRIADFIYMAALLISIKAKMLFPKPPAKEEEEPEDPRQELVERLVEYLRYKEATEALSEAHAERSAKYTRPASVIPETSVQPEKEIYTNATVFDLISSLRRLLLEAPDEPVHAVVRLDYTVEEQQVFVRDWLMTRGAARFTEMVRSRTKPFIIATFLAVLELARAGEAVILLRSGNLEDFTVELQHAGHRAGEVNGHAA